MAKIPYQDKLESYKLFGNTGLDYLTAFALLVVYFFIFYIIKFYAIRKIKHIKGDEDRIERAKQVATALDKGLNTTLAVLIGINFGVKTLNVPSEVDNTISFVLIGLVAFYLIKLSNLVITITTTYYIGRRAELRHIVEFLKGIIQGLVAIIIFLWFLSSVGVNITAYVAGLSVLALAIAFAIQNILMDIFASMVLFFDRPFELGETIRVGSDVGKVEKMGIRSTRLRTPAGNLLIISNRDLSNQRISNLADMKERRIVFTLGVSCETKVSQLREIPIWIQQFITEEENARFDRCHLVNLGNYSWDFEVVYFITTSDYSIFLDVQQRVYLNVLEKLENENVEIPFPTQTVYRK